MSTISVIPPQAAWINPQSGTPTQEFYKFIVRLAQSTGSFDDILVLQASELEPEPTDFSDVLRLIALEEIPDPVLPDQAAFLAEAMSDAVDAGAFGGSIISKILGGTGITVTTSASVATVSLSSTTNNEILANISGGVAAPIPNSMTAILDSTLGSLRGDIIFRGAANWAALALGSNGQTLISNGTDILWGTAGLGSIPNNTFLANTSGGSAAPIATTETAFLDSAMGSARGDILYRGAANWAALALGTTGQMVRSNGTDITWASAIGYAGDQSYQTANWAPGTNFSTNCSFYVSGTTGQASEREILAGSFFVSNLGGNQASSPQRDKVCLSGQIEGQVGTGDTWAIYGVNILDAGSMASTGYTAFGIEVDVNNNTGVSLANPTTIGGHTAQAYGVAVTGSSGNPCTAGFWVSGVGSNQWDRGLWLTACITTYGVLDQSTAVYSYFDGGAHTHGLYLGGSYAVDAIFGPSNGTVNFSINGSGYVLGPGYTTHAGIASAYGGHVFNINWTGVNADLWIDSTNVGTFSFVSDRRLKRDIAPLSGGLDRIKSLRPITHNWRDAGVFKDDGVTHRGFIADELQSVIPTAATGSKGAVDGDGNPVYQTVVLYEIIPDLVSAIQELSAQVQQLQGTVH